jgi:exo-poly-alpha-galacturonosidase
VKVILPALLLTFFWAHAVTAAGRIKPAKRYPITQYGAKGDGRTLNTKAIQAAIDACAAQGGGVVVVPRGTFLTGALFLKQGVNFFVEKEGVLQGTADRLDYPQVRTRWEGVEREWTAALLNADGVTGLELSGEGTIDGNGEEWVRRLASQRQAQPRDAPATRTAPRYGRPRLISIENSRRVRITGLSLRNQAVWCLHILYSEDVVVEGLTIRAAHNIPSSDGVDVDSSRNVRIRRVDIDVNDDCISIKSGRDEDGLRVNRPSEDIIIENSRFGYGHGGVAMGSETSGGIRNVEIRDCVAEGDNWAPIRFKTQPSRGGTVEHIVFRNIQLRNVRRAFEMNMEWRSARGTLGPPAKSLPVFRHIQLINITGTARSGGLIRGLKDSPISDIKFRDCRVTAQTPLVIEHARRVDLEGLSLTVKEGEPIVKRDVE